MPIATAAHSHVFRFLFNNSEEAIVIANAATQQIEDANEKAVQLFGYRSDELCKLNVSSLFHPSEGLQDHDHSTQAAGTSTREFRTLITRGGKEISARV